MSHSRRPWIDAASRAALVLALALTLPPAAAAAPAPDSRWQGGGSVIVSVSKGDLRGIFGTGAGIEPFGVFRFDRAGAFGLRVQGGMIDYGSDVRSVPLVGGGPSIGVQLQTKRTAVTLGVGPQLSWPRGRLHPYAFALAGAAYFTSRADLSGYDSSGVYRVLQADVNRAVVGAGAGGGLGFRITETIQLDAGLEYRRYRDVRTIGNGAAELPTGEVFMTENRGDLGMLVVRAGAIVSFPPRRSPHALTRK